MDAVGEIPKSRPIVGICSKSALARRNARVADSFTQPQNLVVEIAPTAMSAAGKLARKRSFGRDKKPSYASRSNPVCFSVTQAANTHATHPYNKQHNPQHRKMQLGTRPASGASPLLLAPAAHSCCPPCAPGACLCAASRQRGAAALLIGLPHPLSPACHHTAHCTAACFSIHTGQ